MRCPARCMQVRGESPTARVRGREREFVEKGRIRREEREVIQINEFNKMMHRNRR